MAQNTQEENKAIYLDPFRYNQFQGFNSHNHIVVTEVGEGTSVVEVEMTQDAMNPLGMAHGKEGRTTGLVTAEVFNDAGELLATASVMVYYVDENTYADETMQ